MLTTMEKSQCLSVQFIQVADAIKPPPDDDWFTFPPEFTLPTTAQTNTPTQSPPGVTTVHPTTPTHPPFTFPPEFTFPTLTLPTRPTFPTQQTFPTVTFPTKPRPTSPTATATLPAKNCRDIQNRHECISNRRCPEGPEKSFCRWIPIYSKLPLDRPIGEYETGHHNRNKLEKRQIGNSDDFLHLLQSLPDPRVLFNHGFCTCCTVTACEPPQQFNSVYCRCECPKGMIENIEGQCIGK